MSEAEWQTRLDLAACYRLVDLFGWSDLVNTRITARVPGQHDHFLINPYGHPLIRCDVPASQLLWVLIGPGKKRLCQRLETCLGDAQVNRLH
jgi:ribulose-5-phosphate 4-epimerase/fuculose-1-phosphate aldolase